MLLECFVFNTVIVHDHWQHHRDNSFDLQHHAFLSSASSNAQISCVVGQGNRSRMHGILKGLEHGPIPHVPELQRFVVRPDRQNVIRREGAGDGAVVNLEHSRCCVLLNVPDFHALSKASTDCDILGVSIDKAARLFS